MANIVSRPTERGLPQIQYPIGGAAWPGGGGFFRGSGAGFGAGSMFGGLARRRLMGAAPFPGSEPGAQPELDPGRGLPQIQKGWGRHGGMDPDTGVLGELGISPEGWAQNRQKENTPFSELQGLVDSRERANSMLGMQRQQMMGQGVGFGMPDMLRKLLMARMGGM